MARPRWLGGFLPIALLAFAFVSASALGALAFLDFGLPWVVVAPGGSSSGGDYSLDATMGQPEAGALSGGDYSLAGGFRQGVSIPAASATPTPTPVPDTSATPTPSSTPTPDPSGAASPTPTATDVHRTPTPPATPIPRPYTSYLPVLAKPPSP